jgi:small multidrug resistance pump
MPPILLLLLAIVSEVVGTSALKASHGFTRPWPSLLVVAGYSLAFYLMSLTLKAFPVSTAYAIWSGLGTAAMVLVGVLVWREALDLPRLLGIALIIGGVVVLNVSSGAGGH